MYQKILYFLIFNIILSSETKNSELWSKNTHTNSDKKGPKPIQIPLLWTSLSSTNNIINK